MSWTTKAEQICRAIAGEDLADRGCYILDAGEAPNGFKPNGCGGFTSAMLDDALRPWLESSGRWVGRGFACVVDPQSCTPLQNLPTEWLGYAAVNAAAHELCHYLPSLAFQRLLERLGTTPTQAAATPEEVAQLAAPLPEPPAGEPWQHHADDFIRCAIHVSHRAKAAGYDVSLNNMHAINRSLSPARFYVAALGDEPERRAAEPISAILCDPPMETFQMLFETDTKAHRATMIEGTGDRHVCNSCQAFREKLCRANTVTTFARRNGNDYNRCHVCGHEWTAQIETTNNNRGTQ